MLINPFVCNAPFLYPLKTSENLKVSFLMFSGGREMVHWEQTGSRVSFLRNANILSTGVFYKQIVGLKVILYSYPSEHVLFCCVYFLYNKILLQINSDYIIN